MASMIRLPNGRLLHANAADPKRRVRLALRESSDDGSTWSQPWIVDSGKCAYSSLVAFEDGDVGVLFEHGLADSIGWMSFVLAR
jgi:sialidase-1